MSRMSSATRRLLYARGHPNRLARLLNRGQTALHSAGIWPKRLATLDVRGRRTGVVRSLPVVRERRSCGGTSRSPQERVRTSPSIAMRRSASSTRSHRSTRSSACVPRADASTLTALMRPPTCQPKRASSCRPGQRARTPRAPGDQRSRLLQTARQIHHGRSLSFALNNLKANVPSARWSSLRRASAAEIAGVSGP